MHAATLPGPAQRREWTGRSEACPSDPRTEAPSSDAGAGAVAHRPPSATTGRRSGGTTGAQPKRAGPPAIETPRDSAVEDAEEQPEGGPVQSAAQGTRRLGPGTRR